MQSVISKSFLVIVILCNSYFTKAQLNLSKYEVGLSGGVMVYQGDLTPERFGAYKTMKPQFALHIYRIVSNTFSVRFNFNRGKLYGNDAVYTKPEWRQQRNFNFTTPVTELSLHGVWSFLENKTPKFSPYIFAGFGVSFLKIKRDYSNINTTIFTEGGEVQNNLAIDAAKTLPKILPVVPVGVGVRYYINDRFSAIAETNYRLNFTDYLDGFSKAANPKLNDHYLSHSVGILYSFSTKNDKGLGCPTMKY